MILKIIKLNLNFFIFLKTKRQLGETWQLKQTFTGMKITWMRACVLMPTYFIWLDSFRRHFDSFFRSNMMGPFLGSQNFITFKFEI